SVIKIKEVQNKVIIRFDIRDTGVGIPSDKIEKLFKSFSQIDDNLTRKYGGTGLGLYISKEIVDMMGGEIYCESTVGEGSVFHFTIPFEISDGMQEEKTAKAKTISEVSSIYSDLSLNLLIIEDSYINQEVIKEALNSTNCRYKVAENGKIGVYYYSNEKFDAVLLDIQMPEMDGFETIKALLEIEAKNSLEHTPIIALTAHDDDETIEAIKEAGFDYIITKPIDWENFFEVLIKYSPNITNNTIDVTKLLVSINHNKALLNKLIKYFIENSPVQINNLEKAILENDLEQVDRISHKLKSEVGNFGAEKAINILSEINRLSRNNTNRNLGKLFRIFREEINKVIQYLERYIEINI
ncbi:MAG TPA: response regulator, partial [Bacteroidota bacterium]|nr:response regulator [Bacteroidota bacterium]